MGLSEAIRVRVTLTSSIGKSSYGVLGELK